jgi:hypothetical protein
MSGPGGETLPCSHSSSREGGLPLGGRAGYAYSSPSYTGAYPPVQYAAWAGYPGTQPIPMAVPATAGYPPGVATSPYAGAVPATSGIPQPPPLIGGGGMLPPAHSTIRAPSMVVGVGSTTPAASASASAASEQPEGHAKLVQKLINAPKKNGAPTPLFVKRMTKEFPSGKFPADFVKEYLELTKESTPPDWLVEVSEAPEPVAVPEPAPAKPAPVEPVPAPAPVPSPSAEDSDRFSGMASGAVAFGNKGGQPPARPSEDGWKMLGSSRDGTSTAPVTLPPAGIATEYTPQHMYAIREAMKGDFRSGGLMEETPTTLEEWHACLIRYPVEVILTDTPLMDGKSRDRGGGMDKRYSGPGKKRSALGRGSGRGGGRFTRYTVMSAAQALHKSENAYRPGSELHKTPLQKMRAKVVGICNKLSKDNKPKLLGELCSLEMNGQAMVDVVVTSIFDKALEDAVFQDLFAELCFDVANTKTSWNKFVSVYHVSAEDAAENKAEWDLHIQSVKEELEDTREKAALTRKAADAAADAAEDVGTDGADAAAAEGEDAAAAEEDEDDFDYASVCQSVAEGNASSHSLEELERAAHAGEVRVRELERELVRLEGVQFLERVNRPQTETAEGWWFDVSGEEENSVFPYGPFSTEEEAKVAAERTIGFRRLLLNQCQVEFEKEDIYSELDVEARADAVQKAKALEKGHYSLGLQREHRRRAAVREIKRKRIKARMLANVGFIGHLYNIGLAHRRITFYCARRLVEGPEGEQNPLHDKHGNRIPDPEDAEAFCKLVCQVGYKLSREEAALEASGKPDQGGTLAQFVGAIKSWSTMEELPRKVRFLCLDVLDAQRRGDWKLPDTHVHASHKTMSKAEFQKHEAEQERERMREAQLASRRSYGADSYGRGGGRSGRGGGDARSGAPSRHAGGSKRDSPGNGGNPRSSGGRTGGSPSALQSKLSRAKTNPAPASSLTSRFGEVASADSSASASALEGEALARRVQSIYEEEMAGAGSLETELAEIRSSPGLAVHIVRHAASSVCAAKSEADRAKITEVLAKCASKGFVTPPAVVGGFEAELDDLPSKLEDGPKLPDFLGSVSVVPCAVAASDDSVLFLTPLVRGRRLHGWRPLNGFAVFLTQQHAPRSSRFVCRAEIHARVCRRCSPRCLTPSSSRSRTWCKSVPPRARTAWV